MMSVRELPIYQRGSIDRYFAILGLVLGIVLVTLYILKSPNPYLLGVGITAVISGILYLRISKSKPQKINTLGFNQARLLVVSNIVFFAITTLCVYLSTTSQYTRPLLFFVLFSIAFTLIGLEILFITNIDKRYEVVLLLKIILISFILRSSIYFQFPSIIGVDPWFHKEYIQTFIDLGYIPHFIEYLQSYYLHFPLMHLNVSLLQIVSSLEELKTIMFSSMGISLIMSTLFVFLLGKKLFGKKIGLLSILLINFSEFHMLWGIQIIATTLGIILFTTILYLILTKDISDVRIKALLFIYLITIVLTHTISSFAVLILLIIVFTIQIVLKAILGKEIPNGRLKFSLILCFILILMNYWIYVNYISQDQSFFNYTIQAITHMIENVDFLNRPMESLSDVNSNPIGIISTLANIAGFLILLYFTIIGFLTSIRGNIYVLKLGLLTFALFIFIFAFPLLGVRTIIPTRWFVFLYIPLVILASYGIIKQLEFTRKPKIRYLLSAIVLFSFCFLMITNTLVNMDTPLYNKDNTYRYAYIDTELTIAEWLDQRYSGKLTTDYYYGKTVFEIGLHQRNIIYNLDDCSEGIAIWRDYMLNNPVLAFSQKGGTSFQEYRILGEVVQKNLNKNHKIYSNGNSAAFKLKNYPHIS